MNFKGWNIDSLRIGQIIIFIPEGSMSVLKEHYSM